MNPSLNLEPVSKQHAAAIQRLATGHPDIVKLTRLPDPYPANGAEDWIAFAVPRHITGAEYSFVVKNDSNAVVGTL